MKDQAHLLRNGHENVGVVETWTAMTFCRSYSYGDNMARLYFRPIAY
jgi:hypothetical protein